MSGCLAAVLKMRVVPLFFAAWFLSFSTPAARAALTVAELRCENMLSPLGIDVENPRLGWQLRATLRGENQAAYQILVATTAELLARDQGDLWNTGRVESPNTLHIPYAGRPLATSQQVFWKVRVWSSAATSAQAQAQPSPWSPVATFTMGVLDTPRGPGWQPGARWITDDALRKLERNSPLHLRREFTVRPGLTRAIAHITGLGCYDFAVNGTTVESGYRLLPPHPSVFSKTCHYDTYDLTHNFVQGANVLSFILYGGVYNLQPIAGTPVPFTTPFRPLMAFGQIRLEYADGTVEMIYTDASWRANSNPDFKGVHDENDKDDENEKWRRAGYDDSAWAGSVEARGPAGKLRSGFFDRWQSWIAMTHGINGVQTSSDLIHESQMAARFAQMSILTRDIGECSEIDLVESRALYRLNWPAMRYMWNLDRGNLRFLNNMADSQTADGLIPNLSPEYKVFTGALRDAPECGSAFITVAWQHYLWTADAQPLQKHFAAMNDYADYLGARATKHLLAQSLPALSAGADAPPALVATAAYYETVHTLARIAETLGRADDASRLSKTASSIAEAFNKAFLNTAGDSDDNRAAQKTPGKKKNAPSTNAAVYANGSQISQAIALATGLVPPGRRAAALDALVARIRADGDVVAEAAAGRAAHVWRALAQGGRFDVILAMLERREKSGGGFQGTLLEDARKDDAVLTEWLYRDLAGLQPDPAGPGFKKIIICPRIVGDITYARATHNSPRGLVISNWRLRDGKLTLEITIPAGATATVHVPTKNPSTVREGGLPAAQSKGVHALRGATSATEAVYEVESGQYVFSAEH